MDWHENNGMAKEKRLPWGSVRAVCHHSSLFTQRKPEREYFTLCVELGNVERFPDYEVIWTVRITERLRHP
jgi:hypothetical protein